MSEMRAQLVATAEALFPTAPDWLALADAGFPFLLVSERQGGFGGDWGDAEAILRVAGATALAQPIGEAMVALALPENARWPHDGRLPALAAQVEGVVSADRFTGVLAAVPWGRAAGQVLADCNGRLLLLPAADHVAEGSSPAGEPRDTLHYADAPAQCVGHGELKAMGAFVRVAQSAGALAAALDLAVAHVNTRVQFGKPLARLQAVQQALAVLASEAAALGMASAALARALDAGDASFEIPAAKLRANLAITRGVAIAHQVHGAIGFTRDYPLHPFTRRLMGWRSDFGNDAFWADRLGTLAVTAGGAGLWADITRRGDR
ncbi:MAG: acyl-CoA dehydrogenase [Alphaproteobacteria bacterium PA4]|nr:MAG: acyl-CoA dehydrogenase [Alphaproteobacteria bacterium PA4]